MFGADFSIFGIIFFFESLDSWLPTSMVMLDDSNPFVASYDKSPEIILGRVMAYDIVHYDKKISYFIISAHDQLRGINKE